MERMVGVLLASSVHRLGAGEHFAVGCVADAPHNVAAVQFQPSTPAAGWAFHCPRYSVLLWGLRRVHRFTRSAGCGGLIGVVLCVGHRAAYARCAQPGARQRVGTPSSRCMRWSWAASMASRRASRSSRRRVRSGWWSVVIGWAPRVVWARVSSSASRGCVCGGRPGTGRRPSEWCGLG